MKKAIGLVLLFMLIVIGSIGQPERAIHRDSNAIVAFNSLYVYRKLQTINVILTITGYRTPGQVTIEQVHVQYGTQDRMYRLQWQPHILSYNKAMYFEGEYYSQEISFKIIGSNVNWDAPSEPLSVYLVVNNGYSQFIIANTSGNW